MHKNAIFDINDKEGIAEKLFVRLPLLDQQLNIMCDANEHVASYVLLIEDYIDQRQTPSGICPGSFWF